MSRQQFPPEGVFDRRFQLADDSAELSLADRLNLRCGLRLFTLGLGVAQQGNIRRAWLARQLGGLLLTVPINRILPVLRKTHLLKQLLLGLRCVTLHQQLGATLSRKLLPHLTVPLELRPFPLIFTLMRYAKRFA
jgi:hypothetical protein